MSKSHNEPDGTVVADRVPVPSAGRREPGWYPLGRNPNEQSYWDGEQNTGTRHWVGGQGWVEGAAAGPGPSGGSGLVLDSLLATESSRARKARTASASFSVGGLGLIVAGIALMYGSVGTWIQNTVSFGTQSLTASVNGTDPSITSLIHTNGWVTFIAGTVLLVFGGLLLLSEDGLFAALSFLVSFAAAAVSTYDMTRVVQKVSGHADASVGAGLICVLAASVLALLISALRVYHTR
jgi:hypothetical protein